MKRIIIAGAGFAGISAMRHLGKRTGVSRERELLVFDRNGYTTIIPSLPDVAAGRLDRELPRATVESLLPAGAVFKNEAIRSIDLDAGSVSADSGEYEYDYLLLAAGSVTNLFGFDQHPESIFVLDSLDEAVRTREAFVGYLSSRESPTLLISGAGYTGLETACFLNQYARTNSKALEVILVERADRLLGQMPATVGKYVESLIYGLGFHVLTNTSVSAFNGTDVTLETGELFEDVFFVWTSGTKRAIEDISGELASLPDGRMRVNEFLQVRGYDNVFAAGDFAAVESGDAFLRKAVTFSVSTGAAAGRNIARSIDNAPLKRYRPVDPGWVIPVYPSSIGKVLGVPVRGRPGLGLHYLSCGYRTHDIRSALGYAALGLKNMVGMG